MLPTADDKYGVSNMAEAMKWVSVVRDVPVIVKTDSGLLMV